MGSLHKRPLDFLKRISHKHSKLSIPLQYSKIITSQAGGGLLEAKSLNAMSHLVWNL